MLSDSTTRPSSTPGRMGSHQATLSSSRPSAMSRPQVTSGGCTPTPRKLSPASASITWPISTTNSTRMRGTTLGSTWVNSTAGTVQPVATAASM